MGAAVVGRLSYCLEDSHNIALLDASVLPLPRKGYVKNHREDSEYQGAYHMRTKDFADEIDGERRIWIPEGVIHEAENLATRFRDNPMYEDFMRVLDALKRRTAKMPGDLRERIEELCNSPEARIYRLSPVDRELVCLALGAAEAYGFGVAVFSNDRGLSDLLVHATDSRNRNPEEPKIDCFSQLRQEGPRIYEVKTVSQMPGKQEVKILDIDARFRRSGNFRKWKHDECCRVCYKLLRKRELQKNAYPESLAVANQ